MGNSGHVVEHDFPEVRKIVNAGATIKEKLEASVDLTAYEREEFSVKTQRQQLTVATEELKKQKFICEDLLFDAI